MEEKHTISDFLDKKEIIAKIILLQDIKWLNTIILRWFLKKYLTRLR